MTAAAALLGRTRPAERPRTLGRVASGVLIVTLLGGAVALLFDPNTLLFYASYAAVGALLVIRRPGNPIGWILIGIAVGFMLSTTPPNIDLDAVAAGRRTPDDVVYAWLTAWSGRTLFLAFAVLMIIFPSGQLPAGRWRRPATLLIAVGFVNAAIGAFAPTIGIGTGTDTDSHLVTFPNPAALLPDLRVWSLFQGTGIQDTVVAAIMLIGVVTLVVRFRRSNGLLRLQLRWLASAVTFLFAALLASSALSGILVGDLSAVAWAPAVLGYASIPVAISVAVLRYRLFAIDRIVSRTIAYAAVVALLSAAYVGIILALQALLAPITGGQTIAVAASTLAVFALFQPLLRRVRAAVDRRFDRARYDADITVRTFATRLRGDVDLSTVSAEIVGTAASAVRPAAAGIWLRTKAGPARPTS